MKKLRALNELCGKTTWRGLLVLLLFLVAGCGNPPTAAAIPMQSKPTMTPSVTPVPTPTRRSTPSPTATADCVSTMGRVEEGMLPADGLYKHEIQYRVYSPPCYEQEMGWQLPVLYLFHGLYYDDDQWERIGVVETADRLIASGELPPFLIVMPHDPTYREPSEYGFDEAVLEVLIPFIDENYRTDTEREYRAVGGLSRGGGWAIHFAFTHPELFGAVGGHSPIVMYDDGASLPGLVSKIPAGEMPRIYLDIGDKDGESASVTWFEELLTEMDIPHVFHVYPGLHTENYWSGHVEEYLRWYAAGWSP